MFEVIVTILIVIAAVFIIYKNLKKKSKGCNCACCTSKCPSYSSKTNNSKTIKNNVNE